MIEVSNDQWIKYISKYENLIWTIARRISGDDAIANIEDNFSDLCAQALNSMDSYCRKESITVDQALEDPGFDKYTKTVLWNYKAKKGIPLTKRMPFRNKTISINALLDEDQTYDIEFKDYGTSSFDVSSMFDSLDQDADKIIQAILNDPQAITDKGYLKVSYLTEPTGLPISAVRKGLDKIRKILEKTYATKD